MARNYSLAIVLVAILAVPALFLLFAHRLAVGAAGLKPGESLPALELVGLDGRPVDSRSWSGAPTLLVLFRSTCGACEREIEGLTQIAPSLPEMRIILLSLDSAAPRVSTGFQVLCDPSGRVVRKLRKMMVPTLYLVNEKGTIVYVRTGLREPESELAVFAGLLEQSR